MKHMMTIWGLSGCAFAGLLGPAQAQPQGHGFHPPMPDQRFFLQCRLEPRGGGEPASTEAPLQFPSPTLEAELDQMVAMPAPGPSIRVKRYLPQATLEQSVAPEEASAGKPAVQLAIEGPSQTFQRWLIADDAERNRLISFIGTWRYMAVADARERDALFAQFKNEQTREPTLSIARPDGSDAHTLRAKPGTEEKFAALDCRVRVLSFYPHYALEEKAHKPVNVSDKRLNPAALVELERAGVREERWVFAKFPDFQTKSSQLPVKITLDCPLEAPGKLPDFAVVTIGRASHEVWTRHEGRTEARPVAIDDRVEATGSQYAFRIAKFVPSGRLTEQYVAAERKGTVSMLLVETADASGKVNPVWLEMGKQRALPTSEGLLLLSFGPRAAPADGHSMPAVGSSPGPSHGVRP